MTLIGAGNACGDAIPAYNIFKHWPDESWADFKLDKDVRFNQSETAFNNAEIMLDWICHFNKFSFIANAAFMKKGVDFEDWFGCDETRHNSRLNIALIDPDECEPEQAVRKQTHPDQRIYRLLILDSFSGHHNLELYEYCLMFDIILVFLPPHSSHFLQPMDVGVFQHIKKKHQERLREVVRRGELKFDRSMFVEGLQVSFSLRHTLWILLIFY